MYVSYMRRSIGNMCYWSHTQPWYIIVKLNGETADYEDLAGPQKSGSR